MRIDDRARGLARVFVAGGLYSTAGLFTRALDLDAWTILAWRGVFGAAFLLLWLAAVPGSGGLRALMLRPGHAAMTPLMAVGIIAYIFALKLATVAEVMVVYATLPFVTAVVGWVWLGEIPTRRSMVASTGALAGVAVMTFGGAYRADHLAGILLTLLMNVVFAITLVRARRDPAAAVPIYVWSVALSAGAAFAFAPAETIDVRSLIVVALFGMVTLGLAMALYLAGAKLLPSAEVALVGTVDVVVGPVLVWMVFHEAPGAAAAIGGGIVLAALGWHLWPDLRGTA